MKKSEKVLVDFIYTVSLDKRSRIMLKDQVRWFEEKMKAIKSACRKLGAKKLKTNKQGEILGVEI